MIAVIDKAPLAVLLTNYGSLLRRRDRRPQQNPNRPSLDPNRSCRTDNNITQSIVNRVGGRGMSSSSTSLSPDRLDRPPFLADSVLPVLAPPLPPSPLTRCSRGWARFVLLTRRRRRVVCKGERPFRPGGHCVFLLPCSLRHSAPLSPRRLRSFAKQREQQNRADRKWG